MAWIFISNRLRRKIMFFLTGNEKYKDFQGKIHYGNAYYKMERN